MIKVELRAIHHLALNVSDYQQSKTFYVEKLGFRILGEYVFPSGTRRMDCASGKTRLEIFCNAVSTGEFSERNIGYRHLCFHTADIEKTVQEIQALGIAVEAIRNDPMTGEKMTFFYDPDGITIELHE